MLCCFFSFSFCQLPVAMVVTTVQKLAHAACDNVMLLFFPFFSLLFFFASYLWHWSLLQYKNWLMQHSIMLCCFVFASCLWPGSLLQYNNWLMQHSIMLCCFVFASCLWPWSLLKLAHAAFDNVALFLPVACGLGRYYNTDTGSCSVCPAGTYMDELDQQGTSINSPCKPCPSGQTTPTNGAQSDSECTSTFVSDLALLSIHFFLMKISVCFPQIIAVLLVWMYASCWCIVVIRSCCFLLINLSNIIRKCLIFHIIALLGVRISQLVEHWTHDQNVADSVRGRNSRRIFFFRAKFLCWWCSFQPVAHKRPWSFCQKCRWQQTPKHTHTPLTQRCWSGLTMLSRHSVST